MQPEKGYFHEAIVKANEPHLGHPQYEVWINYALDTNRRAQYSLGMIKPFLSRLKNIRHLDIGCGYGGTCIAVAQAGGESIGIDIDPNLLELARLNQKDHPEVQVQFQAIDIMDWEKAVELGKFNLITCDNVIEHAAIPERLIAHIRRLLDREGFAYVTIPNAFSLGQVYADCHYGLFGISLLDPWDAEIYLKSAQGHPSYDVSFYYSLDVYRSLFQKYGLQTRLLNSITASTREIEELWERGEKIKADFAAAMQNVTLPEPIQKKLEKVIQVYIQQLRTGISHYRQLLNGREKNLLGQRLIIEYREELWYLVAAPQAKTIRQDFPPSGLRRYLSGFRMRIRRALDRARGLRS